MEDMDENINLKNIRKKLELHSLIKGHKRIQHLYTWPYNGCSILCYGYLSGNPGEENKHELPPAGIKICDKINESDKQLLFGDLFIIKKETRGCDINITEYGNFYTLCFGGFDDCDGSDDSDDDDDIIDSDDSIQDFIVKDELVDDTIEGSFDEDYDPESEYETTTHVSYDDTFEPDKEKEVEPGTPDKHNMGYYESMDAKWGAGVRHRGNKKVHRISKRAGDKWDRKGGEIIDPTTGKNYASKEDYIKAMSSAATGIYDIPVGKTQKGTKGSETEVDAGAKDENKNYKKIDGRFVEVDAEGKPIEKKKEEKKEENTDDSAVDYNKKNKGKSPFKQNGDKQLKDAKAEKIPTRNDSVISASHHKHITNKNPLYKDS